MKYLLTKTIQLLQKEEVRHYKIMSSNYLQKGNKKRTIELFDELRNGDLDEYSPLLIHNLFGSENRNAYYRLKNRLLIDIEHSILSFHMGSDKEATILNYIRLASIFMGKSAYEVSRHYLTEAETLAIKLGAHSLLNVIYDKFMTLCNLVHYIDPQPYIDKKNTNKEKHEQLQRAEQLFATLSHRLHRSNFSSKDQEAVNVLESIIEELKLSSSEMLSPSFRLKINKCARNILLQKREFQPLSEFLIQSFAEFERDKLFDKKNHEEKIIMLVWLVNALSRLKYNERIIHYTELLKGNLEAYNKLYYDKYKWLYYQCLTVIHIIRREPAIAIQTLEDLNVSPNRKSTYSFFSVYLNLAILYFYVENTDKSLAYLSKILTSSDFRKLSKDLQININIVELILRIESEDFHYADSRYKELRRKYRKEISSEKHREQRHLLEIMKDLIRKPDALKLEATKKKMNNFLETYTEFEMGSNETIDYGVWLFAKINKKTYYEVMLERYYEGVV